MQRQRSLLAGCVVAAMLLVSAAPGAQAQSIYPPPATAPVTQPASPLLTQAAAYEQYLLYLATVANQPPSGAGADPGQYFRNGAAVTSVPSAGQPGSAYFTNGAAVTGVPSAGQPGSAYFSNGADATRLPLTAPSASPQTSPPPRLATLPPPAAAPLMTPSPPAPAPSFSPSTAPADVVTDEPPMSFEEWLVSMGAPAPDQAPPRASPVILATAPPLSEPSEDANDSRPRTTYALPDKPQEERAAARKAFGRRTTTIAAAFAVGLLFGVLAMWRTRRKMGTIPGR